jgi:uncharacterized protein
MVIEFKPSSIHGTGGFAVGLIPAGTQLLEYQGARIDKKESLRRCADGNQFIFYLDAEYDLDGDVETNQARWLNHSCDPNCEAELVGQSVWITARRDIMAGEEITFNYGYDLQDFREHPCHCGAPGCIGYILAEEFHVLVRKTPGQGR